MKLQSRLIILFLVGLCFVFSAKSHAQPRDNDTKLAAHYFNKGQFEKAEIYYEKSYKKYDAQLYFERYFMCLYYQQKYDDCEKLTRKRIKKDPYTIDNQFLLAMVYEATERENEATKVYDGLVKDLQPIQSRVDDLGKAFQQKGMYDYALQTYLKGRKIIRKGYSFQLELASIYSLLNRPADMIEEYLNLLDYSPVYKRSVQTYLSRAIDFESDTELVELLRQQILLKVQKNPDEEVYNEMFIWYYLQKKEFTGAVIQAKALDRKKNESGKRLVEIGRVCQANKAYKEAVKAYQYVIDMGDKSPYYHAAFQSKLEVQFEQVTTKRSYSRDDVVVVANDFEQALADMGKSKRSLGIMIQLSKIYAFHLDEADKALTLIDEALALPVNRQELALLKVLKGDVLVVSDNIWEASLLYMQVEKEFSEDVLGHEAKFKNAKVFYYDGEFEYAKAQLDVLKASTSKLIANDAMQLSLLLQDNLGIDTTRAPVQMYANADLLLVQNKYDEAITMLDSLERRYPFHSMVDEVLFKKAEVYEGMQEWDKAVELYTVVVESYSHDILGDDATYRLAEIYEMRLLNKEKAAEFYKKILFDFSGSLYTADAREKYRNIVAEFN